MALDISFDKIAAVYDAQRAHPPAAAAAIGAALVELTGRGAPILELGVGTGRIAIPLAAAGGFVAGLDVSGEMLGVAAGRAAAAGVSLELLRGDAQALPFADATFRAALAVHVLHLLPDWRDPESCVGLLRGRLRNAAVELMPGSRPPGAGAAVTQALARHGGVTAEPVIAASWVRLVSPAEVIAGMAARVDSETWVMPEELLEAAVGQVRAWAETRWGDLEEPQAVEHRFLLTVTHFSDHIVKTSKH